MQLFSMKKPLYQQKPTVLLKYKVKIKLVGLPKYQITICYYIASKISNTAVLDIRLWVEFPEHCNRFMKFYIFLRLLALTFTSSCRFLKTKQFTGSVLTFSQLPPLAYSYHYFWARDWGGWGQYRELDNCHKFPVQNSYCDYRNIDSVNQALYPY